MQRLSADKLNLERKQLDTWGFKRSSKRGKQPEISRDGQEDIKIECERDTEGTDGQKWSRIMRSHRLLGSILYPYPISHSHYACCHKRLTGKKRGKNTTYGSF